MKNAELRINPAVLEDLQGIKKFLIEMESDEIIAIDIIRKIIEKIEVLKSFPEIGNPLSSIININTDYRYLKSGNYLIFYRYDNNIVKVNRVIYGKRDYLNILFQK